MKEKPRECTCNWGYVLCNMCLGYGKTKNGKECPYCDNGKLYARLKINPACPLHGKDKHL